jgi:hypothetical protein
MGCFLIFLLKFNGIKILTLNEKAAQRLSLYADSINISFRIHKFPLILESIYDF